MVKLIYEKSVNLGKNPAFRTRTWEKVNRSKHLCCKESFVKCLKFLIIFRLEVFWVVFVLWVK